MRGLESGVSQWRPRPRSGSGIRPSMEAAVHYLRLNGLICVSIRSSRVFKLPSRSPITDHPHPQ